MSNISFYKERKSSQVKSFTLPEKDGHTVSVNIVGPFDLDAFQKAQSLDDVSGIIDRTKPTLIHWVGGPGLPPAKGITRVVDTRHFNLLQICYRGTVESAPFGQIDCNTTQDIVEDGKRLLDHLGINDFYISGFCFGTLIATVMAAQMKERCLGLGLFFPYTAPALDDKWLFDEVRHKDAMAEKLWKDFSSAAAKDQSEYLAADYKGLIQIYNKRVQSGDSSAIRNYARYQGAITGCLEVPEDVQAAGESDLSDHQKNQVLMELHYASNNYFLGEDGLVPLLSKIEDIPTHIVYSSENASFHPRSIELWKSALPEARFVDTKSNVHHMLDGVNKDHAYDMFDMLKRVSTGEYVPPVPDLAGMADVPFGKDRWKPMLS